MKTRRYQLLVAALLQVLALLVLAPVARAAAPPSSPAPAAVQRPTHIAATLHAPEAVRAGEDAALVLDMRPATGWHGYWSNPGDAGEGMRFAWGLPAGLSVGDARYPVPSTLLVAGLMNHVYEAEYRLVLPLTVAPDTEPGRKTLRVEAEWLACTDAICVPERGTLLASLDVLPRGRAAPARKMRAPGLDAALQGLPAPLDAPARFDRTGSTLRLAIPLPRDVPLLLPHVFVSETGVVDYAARQEFARKGDTLVVTLGRATGYGAREAERLSGVLRLDEAGNGIAFSARPGTVPAGGEPVAGAPHDAPPALGWLLLAALAGGLLLNIMPCVFPILSLKALSLARAGESESHARAEGLAYAAGVIVACLALGALLLLLRAGGEQVGWAFQLQEPGVVVALTLLAIAITANLAGLYEIALPGFAGEGGPASFTRSAFATGLLAAFVATPCTGPFMASAMGAALLLPVPHAMALFATLGLGIALPFLALAFVPPLRRRIPRPGPWMARFRLWLALPMGLTAAALLWLVWRLGDWIYLALVVALGIAMLALLRWIGRRQHRGTGARLPALGALVLVVGAIFVLPAPRPPEIASESILDPMPFSEAALAAARTRRKPVFVWMTADWCLTCKVNERVAIEREETRAAFEEAGVVVLRGDWTRRDPAITRYLTKRGAAGVPLYVWYAPGENGEQLPQVLSADMLAAAAATR